MPYFWLTLLILVIDQLVKVFIVMKLEPFQKIWLLNNVFCITYVRNYGAAFGILQSQTVLLIALSLIALIFVWVNRGRLKGYAEVFQVGLGLALGGALGNLIDRVRLGYVVDFLDFQFWPVFNLADIAIVCGIGLIILGLYFDKTGSRKNSSDEPLDVSRGTAGKEEM